MFMQYESLSDDEGDMHDEDKAEESKDPSDPKDSAQGSSKPAKKKRKKRRSKAWETFDELPIRPDKVLNVRCSKCGYTCVYNSVNGTGNMLKHQKVCLSTGDLRQMILSSSQGSISVRSSSFDPKIFRDMITNAVVRHNLPLSFVEYEGIRDAFLYANPQATLKFDALDRDLNLTSEKTELDRRKPDCNAKMCTQNPRTGALFMIFL
ncbi:hypothetical protein POM88_035438 [Heracleum sosnowskyi]|uniref:BED-type domain-containing protein n=1 Tax=Heracleum sosnowskyi TaxID=360622 RepID=A0AAD8MD98_9APIA|nr:hypothetical protein POM88_035438 [Heracleum sosnowskyi]